MFAALWSAAALAAVFAPVDDYFGISLPYVPPPSSLDLRTEGDALGPLMGLSVSNRIAEARQDPRLAALSEFLQQGNLPLAAMALENIRRTSSPQLWSQLPLGDVYYEMGWFPQAAEFCEQALAFNPSLEGARRVLVAAHIQARKPDAALAAAQKYAALRTDEPLAHYLLARALHAAGRTNDALRAVDSALLLDERRADALQMKAQMLLDAKRPRDAAEAALKCRQVQGLANTEITLLLGRAFAAMSERETAGKYLREAATGKTPRLDAVLTLARFLENTDRKEAITILEAALEKENDSSVLHAELARLYAAELRLADAARERGAAAFLEGRTDDALEAVLDATAADPKHPVNYVKASALLQQRGELKAAENMSAQALAKFPRDPEVVIRHARVLAATGRLDDACKLLDSAPPEVRQHQPVLIERARLHAAKREHRQALELLEPILQITKIPEAFSLAGKWRLETGDIRAARDAYARGLRLVPLNAEMLNGYNYTAMLGGAAPADLLPMARKAAELAPGDPAIADTLGWILAESGGTGEALHILRDVITKLPGNPSATYHLALALSRDGQTDAATKRLREIIGGGKNFPERKDAQSLLDRIAPP